MSETIKQLLDRLRDPDHVRHLPSFACTNMQNAANLIEAQSAEIASQREVLQRLVKASSEVSKHGATTGPQWVHLTTAIISAKCALTSEQPVDGGKQGEAPDAL